MSKSPYKHQTIDLATDAIRLVHLIKGYPTDPIRCELLEAFLDEVEGVPYEALSYAWGSKDKPCSVVLDGCMSWVTDNLPDPMGRRPSHWVNALCIDQANHKERGHQVRQMWLVYRNAARVLVWLGQSTDNTDLLMEAMQRLERRAVTTGQSRTESWDKLCYELNPKLHKRRLDGLQDLLSRPWFRRVWVLQEAASARSAMIVAGWNAISTHTFLLMPKLMEHVAVSCHTGAVLSVPQLTQAVLDVMPGSLRECSWRKAAPNLYTLLQKFQSSEASDPRDKVYALLGISSDVTEGGLWPDYEIELPQVMRNTLSFFLFGKVLQPSGWNIPYLHLT